MPRDIPVGNGRMLVTFDSQYQIRDFYYPHVGQENHAGATPFRFGVHTDVPGENRSALFWTTTPGWSIRQRYLNDTLTTGVTLERGDLNLVLHCNDCVDFHRNILVRRIKIKNLASHGRMVKVIHSQDFNMFGSKIGDTAYYDPDLRSVVHYRANRYALVTFFGAPPTGSAPGTIGPQGVDEYATGSSGFAGAEGTWRDAEDGHLQGNPIAQGSVDSTVACHVPVGPGGEAVVYMAFIVGQSRGELVEMHGWLDKMNPQGVLDRTSAYWRLWVGGTNLNFGNLPPTVVESFKRSLLVLRTQIDNGGAIIAANDSDIMQFARDTYSYMWPRDGALVANALDLAGFPDIAKSFYAFCQRVITEEVYFLHMYNPDGSPASCWHPWVLKGSRVLPIQEDETALVVWALWRHYFRYRDIEFIRPLWVDVVQKAADFMVRYRDPRTGLPLPSYDLWEERWGVHAFTVATVYGGLKAAHNFAVAFGDRVRAATYLKAAEEMKVGAAKYLFSPKLNRFVRRLVPKDIPTPPDSPTYVEAAPLSHTPSVDEVYDVDEVCDASLYAIYKFHLFEADDPRVVSTMRAVEEKLWVKTAVGGVARYENDYYHRISDDIANVPGNPWFICTLWLADYHIARAKTGSDLKKAIPILEWAAAHALESGVLAEQVHPYTNEPLSVSPLTWSHATVVSTVIKYLEGLEQAQVCGTCNHSLYRLRSRGTVQVRGTQSIFGRLDAEFGPGDAADADAYAPVGRAVVTDPRNNKPARLTLSIDTRDCIGCDVCVAHCDPGVLKMVDQKAMVDLRNLDKCNLDGKCVQVCPTNVVALSVIAEPAAGGGTPDGGAAPAGLAEPAEFLRSLNALFAGDPAPGRAEGKHGIGAPAPKMGGR
ncbi:MAG: cga [Phycisphaerales bacterium]|nr:cga [Phycisphaerales bacterium]